MTGQVEKLSLQPVASGGDNDVHTGQFIYVYLLNLAQVLNILRYLLGMWLGKFKVWLTYITA